MGRFLLRRLAQMLGVALVAALCAYGLLYLQPGGPAEQLLAERQNGGRQRIDDDDVRRLRERFELDLALPVRFGRWLVGWPRGPLPGGLGRDWPVGCAQTSQLRARYPDGRSELVGLVCANTVTLAELLGRPTSRGVVFGDFGLSQSIGRGRPVAELIASRLPPTLALMGVSTTLALLLALPIGVYGALRPYSRLDHVLTALTFAGASLPSFAIGVCCILVFSILAKRAGLPYLPSGDAVGSRDYLVPLLGTVQAGSPLDRLLHFVMPCAVLTFTSLAAWSRFVRASMREVLTLDYLRTARAKGLPERLVILRHALRNALIPVVTMLGGTLATLFGGALIVEMVFNWPGMGRLFVDALGQSDYNVAMALLLINLLLLLLGYLLADLVYTVVDPRIRL